MKKLFILLVLFSCSEDEPTFKIEGGLFLQSRFDAFVEVAESEDFNKIVPRNNMILRFINPLRDCVNDSKSYMKDGQLYVDIDEVFVKDCANLGYSPGGIVEMIIYQELAHALFKTPFRDCGIMRKVNTPEDFPSQDTWNGGWDYGDYPALFDLEAPC